VPLFVDILLVLLLLPVAMPAIVVISLVLWMTQGRPIFFRQIRVGKYYKLFEIYKFRTMQMDFEASNGSFDPGNSTRVTPVGSFLRRTKLDELPQLFNIIKGEMAFVGPRPEVQEWVECYKSDWERVLSIRPGITDPASIEYRDEEDLLAQQENPNEYYRSVILPHKLDLYREYLVKKSFLYDLGLVLKTAKKVLLR